MVNVGREGGEGGEGGGIILNEEIEKAFAVLVF